MNYKLMLAIMVASSVIAAEAGDITISIKIGSWFRGSAYVCETHDSTRISELIFECDSDPHGPGYVKMESLLPENYVEVCKFKKFCGTFLDPHRTLGQERIKEGNLISIKCD